MSSACSPLRALASSSGRLSLSYTTRHTDLQIRLRLFQRTEPTKFRIDLLGRLFADVAGVQQDHVRVVGPVGLDIPLPAHGLGHAFAVVDVHLTAVGLDKKLLGGGHGIIRGAAVKGRIISPCAHLQCTVN